MKKLFILFCLALATAGYSQGNLFNAGICHTAAAPNFNPGAKGCRYVLDTTTQRFYLWQIGTGWVLQPEGIDFVSGCSIPLYVPTKWQSIFAINGCDSLYTYRAGAWRHLNAGGSGGSGTVLSFAFTNGGGFTGIVTNPTTTPTLALTQQDAAADGTTKGQSTFTAADFNAASGVLSLDYTNGQKATALIPGFLSAADYTKFSASVDTLPPGFVRVFIITGQSNAQGGASQSDVPAGTIDSEPNVYIWNKATAAFVNLNIASNNNYARLPGQFGPEWGIAKYGQERWPTDKIYIIKHALGATKVDRHLPGGDVYDSLMIFSTLGINYLVNSGVTPVISLVYVQGESDASGTTTDRDSFPARIDRVFGRHKNNFGENLAIFAPGVSANYTYKAQINAGFADAASYYSFSSTANATSWQRFDSDHYDYRGQDSLAQFVIKTLGAMRTWGGVLRSPIPITRITHVDLSPLNEIQTISASGAGPTSYDIGLNLSGGTVTLAEGANMDITRSGNTLTFAASGSGGGGTVTNFSAGDLSPLFTTTEATTTTTPALTFVASTAAQNAVLVGPASGGTGAYSFRALAAADISSLLPVANNGLSDNENSGNFRLGNRYMNSSDGLFSFDRAINLNAFKLAIGDNTDSTLLTISGTTDRVGIHVSAPTRVLDVLDASNPQIRLTQAAASQFVDLQATSTGNLYLQPSGGSVLVGVTAPSFGEALRVNRSITATTASQGVATGITFAASSSPSGGFYGHVFQSTFSGAQQYSNGKNFFARTTWANSGSSNLTGFYSLMETSASANGVEMANLASELAHSGSGTITNYYGLAVNVASNSGTLSNTYGVWVGDITTGTQTNVPFSFKSTDANAYNSFMGNTGIGTVLPDRLFHNELSAAGTNDILYPTRTTRITSATATTGFGFGEEKEIEDGAGANIIAATQNYLWSDATTATQDATYGLDLIRAGTLTRALTILSTGDATFAGDVTVPDEVYGSGWNASLEVPTKNAVYDKIETLSGGSSLGTGFTAGGGTGTIPIGTDAQIANGGGSFRILYSSGAGGLPAITVDDANGGIIMGDALGTTTFGTDGGTVFMTSADAVLTLGSTSSDFRSFGGNGLKYYDDYSTAIIANARSIPDVGTVKKMAPYCIFDAYADAPNSGTSETDLFTKTTAANTLAADGDKVTATFAFTLNDLTATAQLRVYFAGISIGNTGALTVSATGGGKCDVLIIRTGSSTARAIVNISTPGASTATYTTETDLTGLDFTTTNILKLTGTAGGAGGGSSDIIGKLASMSFVPKSL